MLFNVLNFTNSFVSNRPMLLYSPSLSYRPFDFNTKFFYLPFIISQSSNFYPSIPNLQQQSKDFVNLPMSSNIFKASFDSFCNRVKQGISTVKKETTNIFVKGKARYQAHYSAISDKVKTYGKNSKFIEKLHPAMQEKMMQLLDWAKSKGISISITSGFRTKEQQQSLQYKNKGGKKVAAKVGSSPHEYGIAVDFKSSNNTAVGLKAKELGMRWGGDWGRNGGWSREPWHIDMSNTLQKIKA